MAAPAGNQFWKLRSKHGRDKIFTDSEVLKESCFDYFEKTYARKDWDEDDWVGKDAIKVTRHHITPFSTKGLCLFLDITFKTWQNYKEAGSGEDATTLQKDILHIITRVEEIIETQQLEGAITGHFNANIIARKLGLQEKVSHEDNREQPLFKIEE